MVVLPEVTREKKFWVMVVHFSAAKQTDEKKLQASVLANSCVLELEMTVGTVGTSVAGLAKICQNAKNTKVFKALEKF